MRLQLAQRKPCLASHAGMVAANVLRGDTHCLAWVSRVRGARRWAARSH